MQENFFFWRDRAILQFLIISEERGWRSCWSQEEAGGQRWSCGSEEKERTARRWWWWCSWSCLKRIDWSTGCEKWKLNANMNEEFSCFFFSKFKVRMVKLNFSNLFPRLCTSTKNSENEKCEGFNQFCRLSLRTHALSPWVHRSWQRNDRIHMKIKKTE